MSPVIDNIAEKWSGVLKVGKANVDDNQAIATNYNIKAIPTILIFHKGEIVERIPSLISEAALAEKLNNLTQNLSTIDR